MTLVVGIDPGYRNLGWSRVAHLPHARVFVDGGVKKTPKDATLSESLDEVADFLLGLQGDVWCMEDQAGAWAGKQLGGHTNQNAVAVREVCGMVRMRARALRARLIVVAPGTVRARMNLPPKAQKTDVARMVRLFVQGVPEKLSEHGLDAIGIGIAGARELVFPERASSA